MKVIKGNLITLAEDGLFDVIIHGCNCFCIMGSGVAKEIKDRYPQAYQADLQSIKGDVYKLGTYTSARSDDGDFVIINAYTQYYYGGSNSNVEYTAIKDVFRALAFDLPEGTRVGIPKIGAGLGRGDWQVISKIIETELEGFDVTVVEYDGSK